MNTSLAESFKEKAMKWMYNIEDSAAAKRSKSTIEKYEERHRSQTPNHS